MIWSTVSIGFQRPNGYYGGGYVPETTTVYYSDPYVVVTTTEQEELRVEETVGLVHFRFLASFVGTTCYALFRDFANT